MSVTSLDVDQPSTDSAVHSTHWRLTRTWSRAHSAFRQELNGCLSDQILEASVAVPGRFQAAIILGFTVLSASRSAAQMNPTLAGQAVEKADDWKLSVRAHLITRAVGWRR